MRWLPASILFAAAALALAGAGHLNAYWMHVAIIAMYYAILAASWSLLAGYVGLFSLSHMAFASIGGYTSALLIQWLGIPIAVGMAAGVVTCCALGGAIGWVCLRMSGPYLAIFTLGFSEIVRITIATEDDVTSGMAGLHTVSLFQSATRLPYFYAAFALLAASLLVMGLLVRTRLGLFYINIPVAIFCALGAWWLFRGRETRTSRQKIDFIGLGLLALWVGALQIMLDNGQNQDWFASPWILGLLVVSVLGFAVFVIWELTDDHPIVDLRVFRHRGFAVSAAAMSFTFGAFFASIVLMPLWLQINLGYTSTLSGYVLAFQAVFGVIVAPIAAVLMTRLDARLIMSVGLVILALSIFYRAGYALNISFEKLILPQLAMGLGIPLFFVPLMTISMTSVSPQETAAASGLINFLRTIAGAIATAVTISAWSTQAVTSRSNLVDRLNGSHDLMARLEDKGLGVNQALHSLDGLVQSQSIMLATNHMFLALGAVVALTALGVWLMPKPVTN